MNDDYLWDKSGEPDPEIKKLEEILGTLRYEPKPLKLPRRRNYLALLAIAATVVMALLAGGLWTQIQTNEPKIPAVAISTPTTTPPISVLPVSVKKRKRAYVRHDRREALAAKQQLMFALRLASEKLNAASRKTQHKAG
jgi:hypothetical protein